MPLSSGIEELLSKLEEYTFVAGVDGARAAAAAEAGR
jgi:hypothetical protein